MFKRAFDGKGILMIRRVYYIKWDGVELPVGDPGLRISRLERIVEKGGVLLWNYKGLNGLLSLPRLRDAAELYRDRQTPTQDESPSISIPWEAVIHVNAELARALSK